VAETWIVLKFGGTSVAGRSQWETIAALADERRSQGFNVLLVCSAVAGVTNQLTALAINPDQAELLEPILEVHRTLGLDLGIDEQDWLGEAMQRMLLCLDNLRRETGPRLQAELLAMGEWLSTRIGCCFLNKSLDANWVDAREALEVAQETDLSPARRWLSAACVPGEAWWR